MKVATFWNEDAQLRREMKRKFESIESKIQEEIEEEEPDELELPYIEDEISMQQLK
jgi:hypothetical protein